MRKKENGKRNNKIGIGIIPLLIFIIIGVTNINACGFLFGGFTNWKEEVLLHDGTKIVIKRLYHLGRKPSLDSHEKQNLDETVKFTLPGTNKEITWKTDFRDEKPEPNNLHLLALDIVNGTPYIATNPFGCIAYNKWARPNPPYIFFKYDGNDWKRIPLEEFPAVIDKVNVIVSRPPAELQKSFYTVEQVDEENNRGNMEETYKKIIRTPIKIWCEELIYDGKTWHDISGLKNQPSYEACLDLCPKIGIRDEYCPCDRLFKRNKKGK